MKRGGRRLSPEESAAWDLVARSVRPLRAVRSVKSALPVAEPATTPQPEVPVRKVKGRVPPPMVRTVAKAAPPPIPPAPLGLDAGWEKKIAKGALEPDFSLDLHGSNLDQAYDRLMHGLSQAKAMGARVVLVVAGKPRPAPAADRGETRGAIRAKIGDWLAASGHAPDIAAIRGAHRRHGGSGALYVVLRRRR